MDKFKQLLQSRKFWAYAVGIVMSSLAMFAPNFFAELPAEDQVISFIMGFVGLIVNTVGYIMGTAVEDAGRAE